MPEIKVREFTRDLFGGAAHLMKMVYQHDFNNKSGTVYKVTRRLPVPFDVETFQYELDEALRYLRDRMHQEVDTGEDNFDYYISWAIYNDNAGSNWMKSAGFNSWGESCVTDCVANFREKYNRGLEVYGEDGQPLVGGIAGRSELLVQCIRQSRAVAQGSAWNNSSLLLRDFYVTKLNTKTNCLYQALVYGKQMLNQLSLHSRGNTGSALVQQAKDLKLKTLGTVDPGTGALCYAQINHDPAKCSSEPCILCRYANSKGGNCDIHVYQDGEYSYTVCRDIDKQGPKNLGARKRNHGNDRYINISGNHADAMIPKRWNEPGFPRRWREQPKGVPWINPNDTDQHQSGIDRLLKAITSSAHRINSTKGRDNVEFQDRVLIPILKNVAADGTEAQKVEAKQQLLKLTNITVQCVVGYMMDNADRYVNSPDGKATMAAGHEPHKLWEAAITKLRDDAKVVLPDALDGTAGLQMALEDLGAFVEGNVAGNLIAFMKEDHHTSLSDLRSKFAEDQVGENREVYQEPRIIRKLKLDKNGCDVSHHDSGVERRSRKTGSFDLEAAPDPTTGKDSAYAAGMSWNMESREACEDWKKRLVLPEQGWSPEVEIDEEEVMNENGDMETFYSMTVRVYGNTANKHSVFGARDAIDLLFQDFLAANMELFKGYTLFAHNGGKYDASMVMRSVLAPGARLCLAPSHNSNELQVVEQNGRYIDVSLCLSSALGSNRKKECIHLRDSLCHFQGSLSALTTEYRVPHPKLEEAFDVKSVDLTNFHDGYDDLLKQPGGRFADLDKYLRHDVLGLKECIDRISIAYFASTLTELQAPNRVGASEVERRARVILTYMTGLSWDKVKGGSNGTLKWLQSERGTPMELDMYCTVGVGKDKRAYAVEVNGDSHYNEDSYFYKGNSSYTYKDRKADDERKVNLCAKNGVKLKVVRACPRPTDEALWELCKDTRAEFKIPLVKGIVEDFSEKHHCGLLTNRKTITVGVDLTSCLTGASAAKKAFWLRNDPVKHPIYSLPREMDSFVRSSYSGGRVECFLMGDVMRMMKPCKAGSKSPRLYDFDVTSLFPYVGLREIPHGEPLWIAKEELNTPGSLVREQLLNALESFELFGTIKCRVKSTAYGKGKRPLHCRKMDGMLVFEHYDTWVELGVFSLELKMGLELGLYEYDLEDARVLHFKMHGKPMREFFEDGFGDKAKQKKAGNKGRELACKVIVNSGYGMHGLNTAGKDCLKFFPKNNTNIFKHLAEGTLSDVKIDGDTTILRVKQDLDIHDYNVQIAAAITSYARMLMWEILEYIETKGGTIVYKDTDSVMTDYNIFADVEFMKRFCSGKYRRGKEEDTKEEDIDWDGSLMGGIKCEITDDLRKELKKVYKGHEDADRMVQESIDKILIADHGSKIDERGVEVPAVRGGIGVDVATIKGNKDYDVARDFSEELGLERGTVVVWKSAHKGIKSTVPSYMVKRDLYEQLYEYFYMLPPRERQKGFEEVLTGLTPVSDMEPYQIQNALLSGCIRMQMSDQAKFAKADQVGVNGYGVSWVSRLRTSCFSAAKSAKRTREGDLKSPVLAGAETLMDVECGHADTNLQAAKDRVVQAVEVWTREGLPGCSGKTPSNIEPPKYRKGTVHQVEGNPTCFRVKPFTVTE